MARCGSLGNVAEFCAVAGRGESRQSARSDRRYAAHPRRDGSSPRVRHAPCDAGTGSSRVPSAARSRRELERLSTAGEILAEELVLQRLRSGGDQQLATTSNAGTRYAKVLPVPVPASAMSVRRHDRMVHRERDFALRGRGGTKPCERVAGEAAHRRRRKHALCVHQGRPARPPCSRRYAGNVGHQKHLGSRTEIP